MGPFPSNRHKLVEIISLGRTSSAIDNLQSVLDCVFHEVIVVFYIELHEVMVIFYNGM